MDHKMVRYSAKASAGFTLIEMIVVIVITGIIAGAVAVFIRLPVQGYVDAARRAEMTDIADAALRRMGRDLRLALPNSIRITDGPTTGGLTLELLLTRTGGRYRAANNGAGAGDFLDFTLSDSSFDQFGPFATGVGQAIVPNSDKLVVYNLGIPGADAYAGDNISLITGTCSTPTCPTLPNENNISFKQKQFPFESPGARFQVVEGPVTYACDTTTGKLTRYWGYNITKTQPTAASLAASTASRALVATNVEKCAFDYTPGVTARSGVVALTLKITESGAGESAESAQLYHEVHVNNVP
jgi:MSHA biogenesis protein MshO